MRQAQISLPETNVHALCSPVRENSDGGLRGEIQFSMTFYPFRADRYLLHISKRAEHNSHHMFFCILIPGNKVKERKIGRKLLFKNSIVELN